MVTLIAWLVGGLICGLLGMWLFKRHARPGWLGFVVGFIFQLAALIVMLIVFETQRKRGAQTA
jgi:uncharacterized membrane protein YeaQ/YmgE (transglycosylase-associated protein family)